MAIVGCRRHDIGYRLAAQLVAPNGMESNDVHALLLVRPAALVLSWL